MSGFMLMPAMVSLLLLNCTFNCHIMKDFIKSRTALNHQELCRLIGPKQVVKED